MLKTLRIMRMPIGRPIPKNAKYIASFLRLVMDFGSISKVIKRSIAKVERSKKRKTHIRGFHSVVFNSSQKMALRSFYIINVYRTSGHNTAVDKALSAPSFAHY